MNTWALVYFLDRSYDNTISAIKICCIIFLIRSTRFLALLGELQAFSVIFTTFTRFATPFVTMLITLYTVYYIFANIGMFFWSGKVTIRSA